MPRRLRPRKLQSTAEVNDAASDHASPPAADTRGVAPPCAGKPRRGYAGRSADEQRSARLARLLDAALSLFSERGYAKTPIELICSRARVTTRHFYEQFDGREALLSTLYQRIVDDTRSAVSQALQTPGLSVEQRMYAAVHAYIHSYTDDPRRARVACIEVIGVSDSLSRQRREVVANFAAVLEAFARSLASAGTLPQRDYHLGALCMAGGTNELLTEWLTAEHPPTVAELTEQLLRFYSALFAGARLLGASTPGLEPPARA